MAEKTNNEDITSPDDLILSDEHLEGLGIKVNKDEEDEDKKKGEIENEDNEEIEIENEEGEEGIDKDSESEAAKAYAQLLVQEGLLDNAETVKSFNDILKLEREKGDKVINDFLEDLPPKLGEQVKAHLKGINVDEVNDTISTIAYLESLTPEAIKNDQEAAIKLFKDLMKLEGEIS